MAISRSVEGEVSNFPKLNINPVDEVREKATRKFPWFDGIVVVAPWTLLSLPASLSALDLDSSAIHTPVNLETSMNGCDDHNVHLQSNTRHLSGD